MIIPAADCRALNAGAIPSPERIMSALQVVMAACCADAVERFVEWVLRSVQSGGAADSPLDAPLAMSGLMCLHRRLRNILFSASMSQLDMPEDACHGRLAARLGQLLNTLPAALAQARAAAAETYVALALDTFVVAAAATPWHDSAAVPPARSPAIAAWIAFLHTLLHRHVASFFLLLCVSSDWL